MSSQLRRHVEHKLPKVIPKGAGDDPPGDGGGGEALTLALTLSLTLTLIECPNRMPSPKLFFLKRQADSHTTGT